MVFSEPVREGGRDKCARLGLREDPEAREQPHHAMERRWVGVDAGGELLNPNWLLADKVRHPEPRDCVECLRAEEAAEHLEQLRANGPGVERMLVRAHCPRIYVRVACLLTAECSSRS